MNASNILGWFNEDDQFWTAALAKQIPKNGTIVEVGSFMGKSSVIWAQSSDPSVKIYCIDLFSNSFQAKNTSAYIYKKGVHPDPEIVYDIEKEFRKNTQQFPNIQMIRGFSPHKFNQENLLIFTAIEQIDLFFLDGAHTNPNDLDNIKYFLPKIKSKGIICGHDLGHPDYPDVLKNVTMLEVILHKKVTRYPKSSFWSFQLP